MLKSKEVKRVISLLKDRTSDLLSIFEDLEKFLNCLNLFMSKRRFTFLLLFYNNTENEIKLLLKILVKITVKMGKKYKEI